MIMPGISLRRLPVEIFTFFVEGVNYRVQEETHYTALYSWMNLLSHKRVGFNSPICNVQSYIDLGLTEVGLANQFILT